MPQLPRPLGRDFSRAAFSSFVLQTTTLPEVEAALGAPMRTSSIKGLANQRAAIVTPGTPIALTLVMYLYAPYGVAPKTTVAPMPVKAATLVFFQGRLIGYDVNSSIPGDDNPPIQEDRLGALHKGTTTREEAIAVLGAPSGQSVSIGAGSMRKSIMTYSWAHVADGTVRRKLLKLQFDESGLFQIIRCWTIVFRSAVRRWRCRSRRRHLLMLFRVLSAFGPMLILGIRSEDSRTRRKWQKALLF